MIVKDEVLLASFRRKRRCEFCGADLRHKAEPHHYHAKGMGGGSRLDIPENLIALGGALDCNCHGKAHDCKIDRADILAKIAARLGKTPEEVQKVIWETLAERK